MSEVRTPRALGRSVGLSAARPAPPLGTARDSRRPARPGPPWRSPGRGSASSSCSSTPRRGARGERSGRAAARGSSGGRRAVGGPGWRGTSGRGGRAGPGPVRLPARPPAIPSQRLPTDPRRPAAGLCGRLLEERARLDGRGQPRPSEDVGRAPASFRSSPHTGKRTSARCMSFQDDFL